MSPEVKLTLAVICAVVGVVSFVFGDRELKVRSGLITRLVFPHAAHPYKGKLIGAGLCVAALILLWQSGKPWL